MRSAARSETERSYECLSGSQVVSELAAPRTARRRAPRRHAAVRAREDVRGQLPPPARRQLDPVADGAAVDLAELREGDLRARAAVALGRRARAGRLPAGRRRARAAAWRAIGSPSAKSYSLTAKMSAKSLATSTRELERDRLRGHVLDRDPLLHRVRDEALADDRDRVLRRGRRPAGCGGRTPPRSARPSRRRAGAASRRSRSAGRARGSACPRRRSRRSSRVMSPRSSQMQNVDPSRIVSAITLIRSRRIRPPLDWASALTTISSMLTCSGRVSAKSTQSAMSSAVSGSTPL